MLISLVVAGKSDAAHSDSDDDDDDDNNEIHQLSACTILIQL
jgi:hypothetical protein